MSSIRATWNQHKASTLYLTVVLLMGLSAILVGLPRLSIGVTTTGVVCGVAIVLAERIANRPRLTAAEPAPLVIPGQDAFDLADRLNRGQGMEAVDVIYGGSYEDPDRLALLLEQTALVLRIKR